MARQLERHLPADGPLMGGGLQAAWRPEQADDVPRDDAVEAALRSDLLHELAGRYVRGELLLQLDDILNGDGLLERGQSLALHVLRPLHLPGAELLGCVRVRARMHLAPERLEPERSRRRASGVRPRSAGTGFRGRCRRRRAGTRRAPGVARTSAGSRRGSGAFPRRRRGGAGSGSIASSDLLEEDAVAFLAALRALWCFRRTTLPFRRCPTSGSSSLAGPRPDPLIPTVMGWAHLYTIPRACIKCAGPMRTHAIRPSRVQTLVSSIFEDNLHAKRVASLGDSVVGALLGARLGVAMIGRALAVAKSLNPEHAIKQVDLFLLQYRARGLEPLRLLGSVRCGSAARDQGCARLDRVRRG